MRNLSARFEPTEPDDIKFTATITADLKTWKKISKAIEEKFEAWEHHHFSNMIFDIVRQAERNYTPEVSDADSTQD